MKSQLYFKYILFLKCLPILLFTFLLILNSCNKENSSFESGDQTTNPNISSFYDPEFNPYTNNVMSVHAISNLVSNWITGISHFSEMMDGDTSYCDSFDSFESATLYIYNRYLESILEDTITSLSFTEEDMYVSNCSDSITDYIRNIGELFLDYENIAELYSDFQSFTDTLIISNFSAAKRDTIATILYLYDIHTNWLIHECENFAELGGENETLDQRWGRPGLPWGMGYAKISGDCMFDMLLGFVAGGALSGNIVGGIAGGALSARTSPNCP